MHRLRVFCGLTGPLLAMPFVHGSVSSDAPALLGVDLGFSHITSAYFTASGPVTVSRFEAPQIYRTMMQATINGTADHLCNIDSDDDPLGTDLNSIFKKALLDSSQQGAGFGDIGTIFVAKHLYEYRNEACWQKIFATFQNFSSRPLAILSVRSDQASVFTFPPSYCYEEYGRPLSQSGNDQFLVMLLELTNLSFEISLIEISIPGPIRDVLHTYSASAASWPTVNREEIVEEVTKMFKGQKVANVRSVLFSADAPTTEADEAAIEDIISSLESAKIGLSAKVQTFTKGIHFRKAIGAACVARQLALHPEDSSDKTTDYLDIGAKDEL